MKKEVMADALNAFMVHIGKILAAQQAETAAKLRKVELCLYGTLALAACSLVATVVMLVTR
jgi:hypothetical protein